MDFKISELTRGLFLKYINQHDIDHRFHQNIRTVGTYIGYFLHPSRVVIILFHTELQFKCVGKRQSFPSRLIKQIFHK